MAFGKQTNKKEKKIKEKRFKKNREKHNADMRRRMVMSYEAGHAIKASEKKEEKKKRRRLRSMIIVEGIRLFSQNYVINHMINNLKPLTIYPYIVRGIIPRPIYIRYTKAGKQRNFFSARQVRMINYMWRKGNKKMTRGEKSEYLHNNWTKGELGFGGESDNDS